MNGPLTEALALARSMGCDEAEFFRMADLALESGVFYSGPDAFLIAFDERDCWFIWAAVGAPGKFFSLAPYAKPHIEWGRSHRGDDRVRRLPWSRAQALFSHHGTKTTQDRPGSRSTGRRHCTPAHPGFQ